MRQPNVKKKKKKEEEEKEAVKLHHNMKNDMRGILFMDHGSG